MKSPHDELAKQRCEQEFESRIRFREELPKIVEDIVESCTASDCFEYVNAEVIPSREDIIEIIYRLREVLFPGYFGKERIDPVTLGYQMGKSVSEVFGMLADQITSGLRYDCLRYKRPCFQCNEQGQKEALSFIKAIPGLRKMLATDVRAAYDGDPAAKSYDEIIISYPGVFAIMVYRIAHELYEKGIPLLPRIMTEYAHSATGIDIHPGARIGKAF